jgi:phosphoribosylanthranilate isomerase
VILAGGLTPANLAQALAAVGPAAVDVNSGVEDESGEKDPARVRAFVRLCRTHQLSALL